jgi:dihydrofolate reductase
MRKIVANFFISLDGVVESPDQWHFPYFDEQMGAAIGAGIASSDALLMGRRNYEEWAAYWPTSTDEPFASQMNGMRKYVVSSTLTSVSWTNASLVEDDVAESLRRLKAEPGRDIAMSGSGTLVNWLMRNGLLDELNLLVHPIVVGSGRRLFDEGRPPARLELLSAETFASGVQSLSYHPLPGEAEEGVLFGG